MDQLDNSLLGLRVGDARQTGQLLDGMASSMAVPGPFIDTTITSPPYANLVDYGVEGQIGFSQSYDEYLAECRGIFEGIYNWTKDTGSMWLVVDTLTRPKTRTAPSAMVPLPFELAGQASAVGWTLRDVIVWRKDHTRPWSGKGRLRNGFEYVLLFVKTDRFAYRLERLRDNTHLKSWWIKYPERHNPWGMTPENVWDIPIPIQGSWATDDLRHACPLPDDLVDRMVQLSTDPGEVVFDPFAGSGMVLAVAAAEGRRAFGTELNPDFVEAFEKHVSAEVKERRSSRSAGESSAEMAQKLLTLRALKYPKETVRALLRSGVKRDQLLGALVAAEITGKPGSTSDYARVHCTVVVTGMTSRDRAKLSTQLAGIQSKAPLSKFGVSAEFEFVPLSEFDKKSPSGFPHLYRRGQTWRAIPGHHEASVADLVSKTLTDDFPFIASNLYIDQRLED